MLLSILFAAASLSQPTSAEPLLACVAATVKRNGAFSGAKIEESSGNKLADRQALRYLAMMNLARANPSGIEPYSGFALVKMHGPDTFTIEFQDGRRLFPSCADAAAAH
jgi:hypothetical protein